MPISMKNLIVVIFLLMSSLGYLTSCGDTSNTINNMATELKEHRIFQKSGFRDKKIEVSLSDQAALDLLMEINKLSHEIIILKLKSYGIDNVYRKQISDFKKVLKKRGISQKRMNEAQKKIEKFQHQLAEEIKRLHSLRKLIRNDSRKLKKLKQDFNNMDYAIKF